MPKRRIKILLAVIGLLIFLHYLKIIEPAEKFLTVNLFKTQGFLFQQSNKVKTFFYYIFNAKKIYEENEQLKKTLQEQQIDETAYLILQSENEELKKSLNYLKNAQWPYQTAKIIGQSLINPQIFLLDQGASADIRENNIVIYNNSIVLGKIDQVMENSSSLLLFTDNQSQIAAKLLNQEKTSGLVVGQLGINGLLKMIPQEEKIIPGETVITSGLEPGIPSGLLIGQVTEIKSAAQSLFKEAVIQPFFDLSQINYVQIIKY